MSELNTITARFFDGSGKYVINLNVKSRYAGSSKENLKKTDSNGFFIFQASPNLLVLLLYSSRQLSKSFSLKSGQYLWINISSL